MSESKETKETKDASCPICRGALTGAFHKLPECNHEFHTECVMQWFRSGHESCPLCRGRGVNGQSATRDYYRWDASSDRLGMMRRMARKRNAPPVLRRAWNKLRDLERENREINREYGKVQKRLRRIPTYKRFQQLRRRRWKMLDRIRQSKNRLTYMNIEPLIVVQRHDQEEIRPVNTNPSESRRRYELLAG